MNADDRSAEPRPGEELATIQQAGGGLPASSAVLERAIADARALEGGSLIVVAGMPGARSWPHMPEPWVKVASIEEAHRAWPRRVYQAVLIDWDIPDAGVEGLCARVQGVASCVRFAYTPTTGLAREGGNGPFLYRGERGLDLDIGRFGTVLVDLGDVPRGSMWHDAVEGLMERVTHLCYLERQRCKKAGDRALKHTASVRAWPADPGALRAV